MTRCLFHLESVYRVKQDGRKEGLHFSSGINILIGRSNSGKTTWLDTVDYVLGKRRPPAIYDKQTGTDPLPLYPEAGIHVYAGRQRHEIRRIYNDETETTHILLDGKRIQPVDLQHVLLEDLDIPVISFPRGDPYQPRSWAELRFRSLFRHIYRQQRFWSDLVQQQYPSEFNAAIIQFAGLGTIVYNDAFSELIRLTNERLKIISKYENLQNTLDNFALQTFPDLPVSDGVSGKTIKDSVEALDATASEYLVARRNRLSAAAEGFNDEKRGTIQQLMEEKAELETTYNTTVQDITNTQRYLEEVQDFRGRLADEYDKLCQSVIAAKVLTPYKVSVCPNCEQSLSDRLFDAEDSENCYVCRKSVSQEHISADTAAARVSYELRRLQAEITECDNIINTKAQEVGRLRERESRLTASINYLYSKISGLQAFSGSNKDDGLTSIDQSYGQAIERKRQIESLFGSLRTIEDLSAEIADVDREIRKKREEIDSILSEVDFNRPAELLARAMNFYLRRINERRPKTWLHPDIYVFLNEDFATFKVGRRHWNRVLGNTDKLYFFMAYQFGLLVLGGGLQEPKYPGIAIIDLPAEFRAETITNSENYVVEPFLRLVKKRPDWNLQVIFAGSSIAGLSGVNYIEMETTYSSDPT